MKFGHEVHSKFHVTEPYDGISAENVLEQDFKYSPRTIL